ncbi:MAG: lamin tail domain-containing protein [Methanothrix sp.]|nr:MAG: lamin tail domain-containing protein [Methanothrix sp.]
MMKKSSAVLCITLAVIALTVAASASVVLNEMELNPPEGGAEWVEIYNDGNDSADISGWTATITDGSWVGKFPAVPAGTILEPKGFYVFPGQSSWNHENGGFATLYDADGIKVDKSGTRVDSLGNDFTYGRHPDGRNTNADADWGLGYSTKGRSNVR